MNFTDERPLSDTNPFASQYAWGRAELVDFKNSHGDRLQGDLLFDYMGTMVRASSALDAGPMSLKVAVEKRLGSFLLDVEFDAPTPGIVALFGPSGCGKSTTINIIAGLLRPDRGEISLGDEVLLDTRRKVAIAAERRGIGYVFQDARLFPHLNVASNLGYAQRRARRAAVLDQRRELGEPVVARLARRLHDVNDVVAHALVEDACVAG